MIINDGTSTRLTGLEGANKINAPDITTIDSQLSTKITWSTYKDSMGSDHLPIIITVEAPNFYRDKQPRKFCTRGINDQKFYKHISQELAKIETIDSSGYEQFINIVKKAVDELKEEETSSNKIEKNHKNNNNTKNSNNNNKHH